MSRLKDIKDTTNHIRQRHLVFIEKENADAIDIHLRQIDIAVEEIITNLFFEGHRYTVWVEKGKLYIADESKFRLYSTDSLRGTI